MINIKTVLTVTTFDEVKRDDNGQTFGMAIDRRIADALSNGETIQDITLQFEDTDWREIEREYLTGSQSINHKKRG